MVKRLIFIIFLVFVLALSYVLVYFYGKSSIPPVAQVKGTACPIDDDLLKRLEKSWEYEQEECFLRDMDQVSEHGDQLAVKKLLSGFVQSDKSAKPGLRRSRLEVLNYLVPQAIRGNDGVDLDKTKFFLRTVASSGNGPEIARAILVLGYFREDRDVELFESEAMAPGSDVRVAAVVSLMNNCSDVAKVALVRVRKNIMSNDSIPDRERSSVNSIISKCLG